MASLRHPPLLLTKRLTSFLHLNLSPQVTTLLLLTLEGKLLAYASQPPVPVATLRTHGTVAASLYTIHSNGTDPDTLDGALPPESRASAAPKGRRRSTASTAGGPLAVTIQLESGVVLVIRKLKCAMLFVCMGPPAGGSQSRPGTQHAPHNQNPPQHNQQHLHPFFPPPGPPEGTDTPAHSHSLSTSPLSPMSHPPPPPPAASSATAAGGVGSPPETASILSGATGVTAQTNASSIMFGAGTAGVMATRRHAEELARWLDDKLGSLEIPDDGLSGLV